MESSRPPRTEKGGRALLRLVGLHKSFGETAAIHPIDLEVHQGDFVALLGPSGCGKSTLLRMIGGFLTPTGGIVELAGRDITRLGPDQRSTNMVFQNYGLFPHMTVRQNIAYGLRLAGHEPGDIAARVARMISLVHLDTLENRKPAALSGGQQQRVALARALVMEPDLLLLDECLSALDLKLRKAMQQELRELHRELSGTFVFVTHDQDEAMSLADRIVVMRDGHIIQSGTPGEIYTCPATAFVASFIGEANVIRGRRSGGRVFLPMEIEFDDGGDDDDVALVVRPKDVMIGASSAEADIQAKGRVADIVNLGSHIQYRVREPSGQTFLVNVGPSEANGIDLGQTVRFGWFQSAQRIVTAD